MKPLLLLCLLIASSCMRTSNETAHFEEHQQFHTCNTADGSYRFRYIEEGRGQKQIVFLHGFGANTFTWRSQIKRFAAQGYHVWAFDLIGFGQSDKPLDIEYNLALYRKQTLDFMDAMGIEKAHLVGHSMGGEITLSLAIHAPERLLSMTLINPAAYPFDPPYFSLVKRLGPFISPLLNRDLIYNALTRLYYNPDLITEEQIDAYWQPLESQAARLCSLRVLSLLEPENLERQSELYTNIRLPTLIVWGSEDEWIPLEHLERFRKDMPHAKQQIVEACGHAPQEEQPDILNPHLSRFFRSL